MRVLLVEDSPGDVRLTLEAFRTTNAGVQVNVATNGADALAFLRKEGVLQSASACRRIRWLLRTGIERGLGVAKLVRSGAPRGGGRAGSGFPLT